MDAGLLRFGRCTLDPHRRILMRDGRVVAVQQQPLELLLLLVGREGAVVNRDAIRAHLWPDVAVEYDQNINYAVRQIRLALGTDAERVQTVPRRGYRFLGPIDTIGRPRPRPSVPMMAALATAIGAVFAAGIISSHTRPGAFIYEHLVHPDHCPYFRMLVPGLRHS